MLTCTHQSVRLPDLLGRLLQAALGLVYLAIAAVDVVLHVPQVIKIKAPPALLLGVGVLVLSLERLIVDLRAGSQFVLCICEEIVGAVSNEVGAADLRVCDCKLRCALVRAAHELLAHELFCRG
jgi:hypothetical protein